MKANMDGLILYADDNIFEIGRMENELFQKFNGNDSMSIVPINNLSSLTKTVGSISTYKALILDWNFKRLSDEGSEEDDLQIPDETPLDFLRNNKVFSLVYIYSQADIGADIKAELEILYPGKIFFETKNMGSTADNEYAKIIQGINNFASSNLHLNVPYTWCQAINRSAQTIFSELEISDKFWVKELYYSSVRKFDKKSGEPKVVEFEPSIEVINLFQNLLGERLVQDKLLRDAIKSYSIDNFEQHPTFASTAELYAKLYYTKTLATDSLMTGDVYKLDSDCFGVVISPECDMMKLISKNEYVEILCFSSSSFQGIGAFCKTTEDVNRAYNQENAAIHLLPIFPFTKKDRKTALIDFRFSLKLVKAKYLNENTQNREIKINSPYIQQLRQRYLSYIGRVGVPPIPDSLKLTPVAEE